MVDVQVLRMMDTGAGQARRAWSIPVAAPRSNVLRSTPVVPIGDAVVTTSGERCRNLPAA
jgi:thiamine biosynthesis lipoprotein ApbE